MPERRIMSVKRGLITFLIIFFPGCSVYDNVTSYFNTYYNAKKFFDEAEREIEKTPQKDRDTNYFAAYNISKGIEDKLDKVIEKCSKLIQLYPQSSWVEDAIVMIGKSYVYKGESESAIRKFNELLENFPTSDLLSTSRLWKARAQYNSKREDEAITSVDELVPDAQANGEEDIAIEALMLKGQILIEREDYTAAQASYEKAISFSGSGNLLAIAQFQLGLCHARLSHYLEAAEAYGKVTDYNPTVVKEFQAQIRGGIMLSTAGEYTNALEIFESLQSQALKPDERGLVELEMANTYKRMNDTAIAFEMYDRIDTIYKRTDAAAKSYYERGLSFENDFSDYRKALGFYEKAKAEFPSSEITQIAQRKVQYLTRYFKLQESLTKFDSLLSLKLSPDSSGIGGDSLNIEHDTLDSDQISIAPTVTEETAIDTLSDVVEKPSELESESYDLLDENLELLPEEHSLQTARASRNETSSSLAIDDTKMSKEERSQPKGKSDQAKGALPAVSDSLKGAGKSPPPDPLAKVSPDSIRKLIGQVKFELGVLFLLEMNLPDSALYFYQDIVQNLPESKLVPRAYYAMAEIYREKNDSLMVDSLYKIILDNYDQTEYAMQVKKSLGIEMTSVATDPADSLYGVGEKLFLSGDAENASKYFEEVVDQYPASPQAAKALYALGWLQETVFFNNDSATALYRKLIKEYPKSIYTAEVKPKVAIKDDPKSADKYIKINEIQTVAKTAPAKKEQSKTGEGDRGKQIQDQPPRGQLPDQEPDEEEEVEEEEEPDDTDDGGG